MQEFILTLLKTVVVQIIGIFGLFFVLGYILHILQKRTHQNYQASVGWRGILWTAWIGTPVHEFGHVVLAKLFRHNINNVRIFKPNKETGGLGHVDHSYNKRSLYQQIGNFFIGAAPMIFGSLLLFLLTIFLVPNGKDIVLPLHNDLSTLPGIAQSIWQTVTSLFAWNNITAWSFWLFLYFSFCIASHIAPSKQDQLGMWKGFTWLLGILILLNIIALAIGVDITRFVLSVNKILSVFTGIFIYAIIISLTHFLISSIILHPFKR